ncbi:MAG: hypothetical protein M3492_00365 [Actinomycetota bacterium]|nr:hypothetical protein [Actinomycetota bacterium]
MLALSLYAALAAGAGSLFRGAAARRIFDSVTGAFLILLGLRLAADRN